MLRSFSTSVTRLAIRPSSQFTRTFSFVPRAIPTAASSPISCWKQDQAAARYSTASAVAAEQVESNPVSQAPFTEEAEAPRKSFQSLGDKIHPKTLDALVGKPFNFKTMSVVQEKVFELLPGLIEEGPSKTDILVKARTGTGKTIAFLTPALESRLRKLADMEGNGVRYAQVNTGTLILSPTRELATQIATEASAICSKHNAGKRPEDQIGVHLFVGGMSKRAQFQAFNYRRKDILVATPGRLKDFIQTEQAISGSLRNLETLILDEADTLLDMGFEQDLRFILNSCNKDRQTFLFSATVSQSIQRIAKAALKPNSVYLDCVPKNEAATVDKIDQNYTLLEGSHQLIPHLMRLIAHDQLIRAGKSKVIVFCNTTKQTMLFSTIIRALSSVLPSKNAKVYEIHSGLEQRTRFNTSDRFRKDSSGASILVTSDVSARGVDYPGTSRVIQLGVPKEGEQYVHRVGRTGRGGKDGMGDIVMLPFETGFMARHLNTYPLKNRDVEIFQQELSEMAKEFDSIPKIVKDQVGRPITSSAATRTASEGINSIDEKVMRLQESFNPDDINDVIGGLLGFYVGAASNMGANKRDMPEAMKEWGMGAGGLKEPPYFSQNFLSKLGISSGDGNRNGNWGRPGGFNRGSGGNNRQGSYSGSGGRGGRRY